jgi:hypothetical protein
VHLAGGRLRVLRMDGRRVDRLRYQSDSERGDGTGSGSGSAEPAT